MKFALVALNVRFLYTICNFEIFSTVNSSMASKMAAELENPIYWYFLLFFLNKSIHFCYLAFSTSLARMYNASVHTFNKNKTMTACLLLPVSSQGQQMIIRLRSLRSFCHVHLQCMTAGSSRMSLA